MPKKISRENSNKVPLDILNSACYNCETFKAPTKDVNQDPEELYQRRNRCASCPYGEYKYDSIKKLEKSMVRRWKHGKSLTFDSRTIGLIKDMKDKGMKQKDIASTLGLSEPTISRFFNAQYSIRTNEQIKKVLGEQVEPGSQKKE